MIFLFIFLLFNSKKKRMKLSSQGRKMLIMLEGVKTSTGEILSYIDHNRHDYVPYQDTKGHWTVGVGTLIDTDEEKEKYLGKILTAPEVEALLSAELIRFEKVVNYLVKVPITQEQFDALVIFAFNVGHNAFAVSWLLRDINKGLMTNWQLTRQNFMNWSSKGLLSRRRQLEADLFINKDYYT